MQQEKIKGEDLIIVKPIDREAVIKFVEKLVPSKPNCYYRTEDVALVKEPNNPDEENCFTDNECCYFVTPKRYGHGEINIVYSIPVYINEKLGEGRERWGNSPVFYVDITIDVYKKMTLPEITLREFMGSRYNYNPRITTNMREFIEDLLPQIIKADGQSN